MTPKALERSREIARLVTAELGGRGLFGVELFVKGDDVWFSEVSPRPHDTGMVTMASQAQSEFELHARAILGLPVDTRMIAPAAASAVIYGGVDAKGLRFDGVAEALAIPCTDLRLFGKPESYRTRRMGVALATAEDDGRGAPPREGLRGARAPRRVMATDLVVQGPDASLDAVHELAARSYANGVEPLSRTATPAFRLVGGVLDDAVAALARRHRLDVASVPRERRLEDVRRRGDGHGLHADHHRVHRRDRRHAGHQAAGGGHHRRRRCAARSTSARASRSASRCSPACRRKRCSASTTSACG